MFNRVFAGFLALIFVLFVARRTTADSQRRPLRRFGMSVALAIALAVTVPHPAAAADVFTDGAVVRVQSSSVEDGWLTGRIRLDQNKCWMIHLDRPTRDHYTQLALLVIDALQVSHGAQWTSVAVKPALQATPAQCREYAND